MKKNIANMITGCRILCGISMMFFTVFSCQFYIAYLICGISDMIDGIIARKTNTASEFGEWFDTVADFVFFTMALIKLLPVLHIPVWLWMWIGVIAAIKLGNVIMGYVCGKKLIAVHTVMNKVTGFLLFLMPLAMYFFELKYGFVLICFTATFSAIQEYFIIKKRYKVDKTILRIK